MKKLIIVLLAILMALYTYAQKKKALKLFEKGVQAYNAKNYILADSLFRLSSKCETHPDTYFNLALTKNKLNDFCAFCYYMNKAAIAGAESAHSIYKENCVQRDSVYYGFNANQKYEYYCIISYHKCLMKNSYRFFELNKGTNKRMEFLIIPDDSSGFTEKDFESPIFDISKVPERNINFIPADEPYFPGGENAMYVYIFEKFYQNKMEKYCSDGTIYISFIVQADGSLKNIKVEKGLESKCNELCLNIVKSMPKWIPALMDGKPMVVKYYISISFRIMPSFLK